MKFLYEDINVNYIQIGNKGKPILFLHGFGGDTSSFIYFANELSVNHRCFVIDLPPFGNSDEPYRPWNLTDYVKLLYEFCIINDLKKIDIVAHSFGGRVALKFSSIYNNVVNRQVLTGCAGIKPRFNLIVKLKIWAYKLCKMLKIKNLSKFGSKDYQGLSTLMKQTFVNIVGEDCRSYLSQIKCPTLLVYGSKDKQTPIYMAKKIKRGIKDCALVKFENLGHFAYLEDSKKFVIICKEFFKN